MDNKDVSVGNTGYDMLSRTSLNFIIVNTRKYQTPMEDIALQELDDLKEKRA